MTTSTPTPTPAAPTPPPNESGSSNEPEPVAATPAPADPAPAGSNEHDDDSGSQTTTPTERDVFDRAYVEGLRAESAGHRTRAKDAEAERDTLRRELWGHRVRATNLLADPDDLAYDESIGDDPEALTTAIRELIARKPHMARSGTGGPLPEAHSTEPAAGAVSWGAMLRRGA